MRQGFVIREEPSGPADTPEICRKRTDLPLAGLIQRIEKRRTIPVSQILPLLGKNIQQRVPGIRNPVFLRIIQIFIGNDGDIV